MLNFAAPDLIKQIINTESALKNQSNRGTYPGSSYKKHCISRRWFKYSTHLLLGTTINTALIVLEAYPLYQLVLDQYSDMLANSIKSLYRDSVNKINKYHI